MDPVALSKKVNSYLASFIQKPNLKDLLQGSVALWDLGCCARCVVRFTNQKNLPLYQEKNEVLDALIDAMKKVIEEEESGGKKDNDNDNNNNNNSQMKTGIDSASTVQKEESVQLVQKGESDTDSKMEDVNNGGEGSSSRSPLRRKSPICPSCLGILENLGKSEFIDPLIEVIKQNGFEFAKYSLNINLPTSTLIRQQELWIYLKKKFGENGLYKDPVYEHVIDIKEVAKWILGPIIVKRLGYQFKSSSSDFRVVLAYDHPETNDEFLFVLKNDRKRKRNEELEKQKELEKEKKEKKELEDKKEELENGKEEDEMRTEEDEEKEDESDEEIDNDEEVDPGDIKNTLSSVFKTLRHLSEDDFVAAGKVPPGPVFTPYTFKLSFERDSIFIGGMYNKFARGVSQSPWNPRFIGNKPPKKTESVEELITNILKPHFQCTSMVFSASGREDIDVRMLGNGRPFLIEVINPHRVRFTWQEYKQMEDEVNKSTAKIQIRNLKRAGGSDILLLKDAEENKRKTYRCCVWLEKPIAESDLDFLSEIKDLQIEQKTPIRVLHRRSLATRARFIHSFKAQYINPHILLLDLVTQAGTYIKEFIHGDFGRTSPHFGGMMNNTADILQLDVLNIDIQYPPVSNGRGIKIRIIKEKNKKRSDHRKKLESLASAPEYAKSSY